MKVAVIGCGNGGQAMAAYLAMQGHTISLYHYRQSKVDALTARDNQISLTGKISGTARIPLISTDIHEVIAGTEVIMVVTTANSHKTIATQIAPMLTDGQIILLNPGRTGGALEFQNTLRREECKADVYVAEAQTLVYACRIVEDGLVNIIGIKDKVLVSAVEPKDTAHVVSVVNQLYTCFQPAENVLRTSLENIGAIFHPCVLLFNAATIERKDEFWFYRDMTPAVADFIEAFDRERIAVGKAFGLHLLGVSEWISYAYPGTKGETLCEKMINNPAYYDIKAPTTIFTRQLLEDIPTGVMPILELGKAVGLEMPLMQSMVNVCSVLLGMDFTIAGRTLANLGLAGKSANEILEYLS